jgi:hypothetical protein
LEFVFLDQLVQVDAEKFERHADVISELEALQHVYDVHCVFLILLFQMFQDSNFLGSLTMESLLVADDFKSYVALHLMIVSFHNLAKASFPNDFQNLISVGNVIVGNRYVGALVVVVAVVVAPAHDTLSFLGSGPGEIYGRVAEYFVVLERREFMHALLHSSLRSHVVVLRLLAVRLRLERRFGHRRAGIVPAVAVCRSAPL